MILQIETIANGLDKEKLQVKSLINPWSDTVTVFKQYKEHKLNAIRAYQIRTYLKRHLKGRCTAFKKAGAQDTDKYRNMYSFLHHLETNYPAGGPKQFFAWILRREDFIRSTLKKEVNSSHQRIETILQVCREQA